MRLLILSLAFASLLSASNVLEVPVWEGPAPGTEGRPNEEEVVNERVRKVHQPLLTVHLPPRELASGAAVLVLPGGGYHHLAIEKEGHQIAAWLNTLGVAGVVLKYRLDREEALADAQEALRVIRARGDEWAIDPGKVGVMGFSAGAHLTVNLALHADSEEMPDFLAPIYVSMRGIGQIDAAAARRMPPTFLAGASDDTTTPPAQAIGVYEALHAAGVSVELHLFQQGGHGFGLGRTRGPVGAWTKRAADWLELNGWLDLSETE